MKNAEQIIDNGTLKIGQIYLYMDNEKSPMVVEHIEGKFQDEAHRINYLQSMGACYMLKDLETGRNFDLHGVDYLEHRYKIYPITKENLGFVLDLTEVRTIKKNWNLVLKYFSLRCI